MGVRQSKRLQWAVGNAEFEELQTARSKLHAPVILMVLIMQDKSGICCYHRLQSPIWQLSSYLALDMFILTTFVVQQTKLQHIAYIVFGLCQFI
ncbi:Protein of unknown function [Gryllus bimaculatus]|nr:Protein of unknown function [Gryllus bimaculatus]